MNVPLAESPVDEPTGLPTLKIPSETFVSPMHWASLRLPARPLKNSSGLQLTVKIEEHAFNVRGDFPPPVLIGLYGSNGDTQKLGDSVL